MQTAKGSLRYDCLRSEFPDFLSSCLTPRSLVMGLEITRSRALAVSQYALEICLDKEVISTQSRTV